MNKPVAWIDEETGCFVYSQYDYEDLDEHGKDGLIPLYTHPVKEHTTTLMESREKIFLNESHSVKEQVETIEYTCPNCQTHVGLHVKHPAELTDEEIEEVMYKCDWSYDPVSFAKAILRKAQEK